MIERESKLFTFKSDSENQLFVTKNVDTSMPQHVKTLTVVLSVVVFLFAVFRIHDIIPLEVRIISIF